MYLKHYGLRQAPFANVPSRGTFYRSPQHEEALRRLLYVIEQRKGVAMLTGDNPQTAGQIALAAGIDRVITVSDHRTAEFGQAYGVLVKDLRVLARSVFVVDRAGVIRYIQIVKEVGTEPDYRPILEAVKAL